MIPKQRNEDLYRHEEKHGPICLDELLLLHSETYGIVHTGKHFAVCVCVFVCVSLLRWQSELNKKNSR